MGRREEEQRDLEFVYFSPARQVAGFSICVLSDSRPFNPSNYAVSVATKTKNDRETIVVLLENCQQWAFGQSRFYVPTS